MGACYFGALDQAFKGTGIHASLTEVSGAHQKFSILYDAQAMNAAEARELYQESLKQPHLVTQVVPSPVTFKYDATIQDIIQKKLLGELIYVEVCPHTPDLTAQHIQCRGSRLICMHGALAYSHLPLVLHMMVI